MVHDLSETQKEDLFHILALRLQEYPLNMFFRLLELIAMFDCVITNDLGFQPSGLLGAKESWGYNTIQ